MMSNSLDSKKVEDGPTRASKLPKTFPDVPIEFRLSRVDWDLEYCRAARCFKSLASFKASPESEPRAESL